MNNKQCKRLKRRPEMRKLFGLPWREYADLGRLSPACKRYVYKDLKRKFKRGEL